MQVSPAVQTVTTRPAIRFIGATPSGPIVAFCRGSVLIDPLSEPNEAALRKGPAAT